MKATNHPTNDSVPHATSTPAMQEVHALINGILGEYADGKYIFRGTTEVYSMDKKGRGINSSLFRWATKNNLSFNEYFSPVEIEGDIVEKAKRLFPPNTSNIEILTDLRHYGGNVNLIDFSYNLYVALFFACNGNFKCCGELVGLKIDTFDRIKDIDYGSKDPPIGIIEPANSQASHRRTIAQSSIFVVAPTGYIDKDKCNIVTIEKAHKKNILEYLRNLHNIDIDTIYSDLIGFIDNKENYIAAEVKFYNGLAEHKAGHYETAIAHYDKAIEQDTQPVVKYINRGAVKSALGQQEEAIADYNMAIALDPRYAAAYINRALAQSALGNHVKAIADCNTAITLDPRSAAAYNNRGVAKHESGQDAEAVADFNIAIALNPLFAETYSSRGATKSALKQYKEAIEDYNTAIAIDPQHADAYYNRGKANLALKEKREAIADFDTTIALNSKYAIAYCNRGVANYDLRRMEEANADYRKAMALDLKLADNIPKLFGGKWQ